MKKMKLSCFLFAITIPFFSYSQTEDQSPKRNFLKAYSTVQKPPKLSFAIGRFSKKGNFHEFEVNTVSIISQNNSNRSVFATASNLRYSYNFRIGKKEDLKGFKLFMGFGSIFSHEHSKSEFLSTTETLMHKNKLTSGHLFITPRILYNISTRFIADLSFHTELFNLSNSYTSTKTVSTSSPFSSTQSQTRNLNYSKFGGSNSNLRASIGYLF